MNDTHDAPATPDTQIPEAVPEPTPTPTARQPGATPLWLTGLISLLMFGMMLAWPLVLQQFLATPEHAVTVQLAADTARITALESALKAAQLRIAALEQPQPAGRPTAPDNGRLAALESALHDLATRNGPDTAALESRIAALERAPSQIMPDIASAVANASAALNARIAAIDAEIQKDVAQATDRASRAARLRAATAALEAGQPLGDIADAPPALIRFAQAAPPTEPALRLTFAGYATAAQAASRPGAEGHSLLRGMWLRVQSLVTIRQGSKVLVGAPAAVTLEAARSKLDAGDLAGAVAALAPLDPAATAAMAPWTQNAQALLDARAALVSLAAKP